MLSDLARLRPEGLPDVPSVQEPGSVRGHHPLLHPFDPQCFCSASLRTHGFGRESDRIRHPVCLDNDRLHLLPIRGRGVLDLRAVLGGHLDDIRHLGHWHRRCRAIRRTVPLAARLGLHRHSLRVRDLLRRLLPHELHSAQELQRSALVRRLPSVFERDGVWLAAHAAKRPRRDELRPPSKVAP